MSAERESKLKLFSLGIVIHNKERNSDLIKVTPIEELTLVSGLIADQKYKYDVTTEDHKGTTKSNKVEGDNILIAKWLPFGHSNRMTAPDVIKNETVIIFRFSDTDEYFWTTIMREPKIRRLETVNYSYCNIPKGLEPFDKESSYWIEYSTHDKYIHLHTSKNDGEPFTYDVKIDTAAGIIDIKDDVGNFIEFNSTEDTLTANMNKEINLIAPTINILASKQVNVKTNILDIEATTNIDMNTSTLNIEATSSTNIKSGAVNIDTPMTTHSGDITAVNIFVSKIVAGGSTISTNGIGFNNSISVNGTVTASNYTTTN